MIALVESFPLLLPGVEIQLLEREAVPPHAQPGEQWATFRVIRFGDDGSINDILEQAIRIARAPAMLEDQERVRNCVAAHRELLRELFEQHREAANGLMPYELLFFDELLALARANTLDDFARGLLAKKRLGSLLRRG